MIRLETIEALAEFLRRTGASAVLGYDLSIAKGRDERIAAVADQVERFPVHPGSLAREAEAAPGVIERWLDRANHIRDEHCVPDGDGICVACGTFHGDPCPACGGCGFHVGTCPEDLDLSSVPEVVDTATAIAAARELAVRCGGGMHFDTPAADYDPPIRGLTGRKYDDTITAIFRYLNDPYHHGLEAWREAGIIPPKAAPAASEAERADAVGAVLAQVEDLGPADRAAVLSDALSQVPKAPPPMPAPAEPIRCLHCNRRIVEDGAGVWIDPDTCDPDCTVYERDPYGDNAHEPNVREHPVARLLWVVDRLLDQHGGLLDETTWDRLDAAVGAVRSNAAPPRATLDLPRRVKRTVLVELTIEGNACDDAAGVVERMLDAGDLQDAINDHPGTDLTVVSAIVK